MKTRFLKLLIWAFMLGCIFNGDVFAKEINIKHRPHNYLKVFDEAHLMGDASRVRIEKFLHKLLTDLDIEFLVLTVKDIQKSDIDFWAADLFSGWEVGSNTKANRGLLLVVVVDAQEVRLEVGYDLEHVFTDAFVGYIESEQMLPFFEQGRVGDGVEATLEMIVARAYEKMEEGSYSPEEGADLGETTHMSGGAGARRNVDVGSQKEIVKSVVSDQEAEQYAAQSTPEETLEIYKQVLKNRIKDPDLGIYTHETRDFFRQWTVTNAQQDNEYKSIANKQFEVKYRGNRAVIFYPQYDWTHSPFFLKKTDEGWQLDFATMTKVIRFNHKNYWHFVDRTHPYMFAFDEYMIDKNGFVWFNRRK